MVAGVRPRAREEESQAATSQYRRTPAHGEKLLVVCVHETTEGGHDHDLGETSWFYTTPFPSGRSEPRDPKYLRQEMSKAGKRMWSEKEWILGLSQSE